MAKIFYLHWNQSELEGRLAPLAAVGHKVRGHWSTQEPPNLKDDLPDILVVSLDRLPSHGRAVADWLWEAKKRQGIPIVFAGGKPDKVRAAKEQFPRAHFCPAEAVPAILEEVLAS